MAAVKDIVSKHSVALALVYLHFSTFVKKGFKET